VVAGDINTQPKQGRQARHANDSMYYIMPMVIPRTNNYVIQGAGKLGKNDVILEQANSTGVPPNQKCKQSL
jgi:hypothetical protein